MLAKLSDVLSENEKRGCKRFDIDHSTEIRRLSVEELANIFWILDNRNEIHEQHRKNLSAYSAAAEALKEIVFRNAFLEDSKPIFE